MFEQLHFGSKKKKYNVLASEVGQSTRERKCFTRLEGCRLPERRDIPKLKNYNSKYYDKQLSKTSLQIIWQGKNELPPEGNVSSFYVRRWWYNYCIRNTRERKGNHVLNYTLQVYFWCAKRQRSASYIVMPFTFTHHLWGTATAAPLRFSWPFPYILLININSKEQICKFQT